MDDETKELLDLLNENRKAYPVTEAEIQAALADPASARFYDTPLNHGALAPTDT